MNRYAAVGVVCCLLAPAGLKAEDRTFDSNGVQINYVIEGKGEPVLLIHGFTANVQVQWGLPGIMKALAKDHQVIALDNRGHGKSGKPHDPKKYGMEMVEDAVRLLDHLKIKKAHVVGYSMGAMITLKLMTTHPDRILSATLGGSGGLRENADRSFFTRLADSLDQGKGIGELIVYLTPPGRPKPSEEQIKAINAMLTTMNDTKALAAVVRGFSDLIVGDEKLKANKVPVIAIIGDADPLKRGVDDLKPLVPNLKTVVIENADHMTTFGKPEFTASIQKFIAANSATTPARSTAGSPSK